MRITKESLEKGIIIDLNGKAREYRPGTKIKDNEIVLNLFPAGASIITYGFVKDGEGPKQVLVKKNKGQATMIALYILFYYSNL